MESSLIKYFDLEEIVAPEQDEQPSPLSEECSPDEPAHSDDSTPLKDADSAECEPPTENTGENLDLLEKADLASVAEDTFLYTVSGGTGTTEDKPPEEMNLDTE